MWPDGRIKSSPNFPNSCPKSSHSQFEMVFKITQNVALCLGNFFEKIVTKTFKMQNNLVTLSVAHFVQSRTKWFENVQLWFEILSASFIVYLSVVRMESSVTRWFDYFSKLRHLKQGNLPNSITISQNMFKNLPNTKFKLLKMPKVLQNFAKVAKFRQIWSHWWRAQTTKFCENLREEAAIPGKGSS